MYKNHHLRKNNPEVIRCHTKRAFTSKEAAEFTGQRAYRCPICHFWHRTGPVRPISNPVLRYCVIAQMIALFCNPAQAQVTVDWTPVEIQQELRASMLRRGYQMVVPGGVDALHNSYFIYPGGTRQCLEQRFKFVLREVGTRSMTIYGFGACYYADSVKYYSNSEMNNIILDAILRR